MWYATANGTIFNVLWLISTFALLSDCIAPNIHCNDGTCIENARVCDSTEDCPDGEDEINCGKWVSFFT